MTTTMMNDGSKYDSGTVYVYSADTYHIFPLYYLQKTDPEGKISFPSLRLSAKKDTGAEVELDHWPVEIGSTRGFDLYRYPKTKGAKPVHERCFLVDKRIKRVPKRTQSQQAFDQACNTPRMKSPLLAAFKSGAD